MRFMLLLLSGIVGLTSYWVCLYLFEYDTPANKVLWTNYRNMLFSVATMLLLLAFFKERNISNGIRIVYMLYTGAIMADIYERLVYKKAEYGSWDVVLLIVIPLIIEFLIFKCKKWNIS